MNGNVRSSYTFEQLEFLNITAEILLSWSAPIDLVEQYQIYIDKFNASLRSEIFHKCESQWFGVSCQYTFDFDSVLNDIVEMTFDKKHRVHESGIDYELIAITNLTCYVHLECDRGPEPVCLDWREICDGNIDCIGSGIDEIDCFQLEINQCESHEYQCHNGMCVPEDFFHDNSLDFECLDSTDERYNIDPKRRLTGYKNCVFDPSFRCEDASHPHPHHDLDFACGDGEQSSLQLLAPSHALHIVQKGCRNGRDMMFRYYILLDMNKTNLTYECWLFMSCLLNAGDASMCASLCNGSHCDLQIQSKCNVSSYLIFPLMSISPSHVQSGYFATKNIQHSINLNIEKSPDFYCYDFQMCPFFSPTFVINNRTCVNASDISVDRLENSVQLFHQCLNIYKSGNETDCFHSMLFHCPGTSKCISKRRLLDGTIDCYGGADETYANSCQLNDKYRFHCTFSNKCISNILVLDGLNHCGQNDDEIRADEITLYYLNLCNGYTHMVPTLVDGRNQTDETDCEEWPCNNQYTRCDNAWSCRDGSDEVNCDRSSSCYPDHHECVSLVDFEMTCLPINRSGDGKMDCLGGTDERPYCLSLASKGGLNHYRCWNESRCVIPDCSEIMNCLFEKNTFPSDKCILGMDVEWHLFAATEDEKLRNYDSFSAGKFLKFKYFKLHTSKSTRSSRKNERIFDRQTHSAVVSNELISSKKPIDLHRAWICNRGILIYMGMKKTEHCLCPQAYYGSRCQFQNQRVSLTMKFSKECSPNCFGIYAIVAILIDQNKIIHAYEQFSLVTTENCDIKYNFNLLYRTRPKDQTKNYSIYIHAFDKQDLSHHASWILPVKFIFLPVNRVAAHLIIPSHKQHVAHKCSMECSDHGHCDAFRNSEELFCRCDPGWSGQQCKVKNNECNCSPDSICINTVGKRSICVCPLNKFGPRCFLHSICTNETCKNGGRCVLEDDQSSSNSFRCICEQGFFGKNCEQRHTQIDFSFHHIKIPQSLFVYFVTVQSSNDPVINMLSKKIPLDQDKIILLAPALFNLIFAQVFNEYYLLYNEAEVFYSAHLSIEITASHRCVPINELLDKATLSFSLLRRAKYYHVACRAQPSLGCLYDREGFMCLCDQERFSNCLHFNFSVNSLCQQRSVCENNGECFPDRRPCPNLIMCTCDKCYFGGKCQLTTKGFGLSLDTILAYQVQQHESIVHQKAAVKVSIAITTLIFSIGVISGIFSAMLFSSKNLLEVGCGLYLRTLSILSIVSAIILTLKFWLLIATQSLYITNRVILWINCISLEFILRSLPAIGDWLAACIAIERIFVVVKGASFNKKQSKQVSRWIIVGVILFTIASCMHDPAHRRLIDDDEAKRTWCVVRYSSVFQRIDSVVHVFHFIIPFAINSISSIVIIIRLARIHSNAHKGQSYRKHLRKECLEQIHLIYSPAILVVIAIPRLVISFLSGCMESVRDPWLFLFGYFISFLPSLFIPIIFILPSEIYRKEAYRVWRSAQRTIRDRLYLDTSN